MAGVAVQGGTTLQLSLGDVIGWFGQCPGAPLRHISTAMAGLAGRGGDHRMIHGHGRGKAHLRLMAGIAFGNSGHHWNVRRCFRHRRGRSVVAGVARPCTNCVGSRVREHHA